MSDIWDGSNGNYYHQSGGGVEAARAQANGDWVAAYYITLNQNNNSTSSGNHIYSGGGVRERKPLEFKLIKSIFYLIFIFVPKFIFYYLPFKNFGKTLMLVILAGIVYFAFSDFGRAKMSEYEWSLEPKNIKFNNIDKYDLDAKLVKKYRSMNANGLSKVNTKFDDLPAVAKSAFKGVIREKLLKNPNYFDAISETSESGRVLAASACWYANTFMDSREFPQTKLTPFHKEIRLEIGYMQFFESCASLFPATEYYDTIKNIPNSPLIQPELDRLNSQPLFRLTRNHKIIAQILALLGGILFLFVIATSMKQDENVRKEKKEAKSKLEAEKLKKGEKPKEVTDFKAENNIFD